MGHYRGQTIGSTEKREEKRKRALAESGADIYPDSPDMPWLHWQDPGIIGRIRLGIRALLIIASLFICVPMHYIWRLLRLSDPWPRTFLKSVARIAGAKVVYKGTPLRRNVMIVSNHLSWLDIPVIGGINGTAFVAQDGIEKWPVIGWLCKLNNTIFVSRTNRMGIADQINKLSDALANCWAITIFPEGTTGNGKDLLPFKSPLLKVLNPPPPGILVQPIWLDYGEGVDLAWLGQESAPHNALRVFSRKGNFELTIHFLEPFDPQQFADRKAIASEARNRILADIAAYYPDIAGEAE